MITDFCTVINDYCICLSLLEIKCTEIDQSKSRIIFCYVIITKMISLRQFMGDLLKVAPYSF